MVRRIITSNTSCGHGTLPPNSPSGASYCLCEPGWIYERIQFHDDTCTVPENLTNQYYIAVAVVMGFSAVLLLGEIIVRKRKAREIAMWAFLTMLFNSGWGFAVSYESGWFVGASLCFMGLLCSAALFIYRTMMIVLEPLLTEEGLAIIHGKGRKIVAISIFFSLVFGIAQAITSRDPDPMGFHITIYLTLEASATCSVIFCYDIFKVLNSHIRNEAKSDRVTQLKRDMFVQTFISTIGFFVVPPIHAIIGVLNWNGIALSACYLLNIVGFTVTTVWFLHKEGSRLSQAHVVSDSMPFTSIVTFSGMSSSSQDMKA